MVKNSSYMPEERGFNDILSPQAPVVDESKATALNGIAAGVSGVNQLAKTGIAFAEKTAIKKQAALQERLENDYVNGLDSLSEGVSQGKLTEGRLLTELSGLEGGMYSRGLSKEKMLDLQAKHGRSFRGQKMHEGTDAEREAEATRDILLKNNRIMPGASPEEQAQAAIDFERDEARQRVLGMDILEANAKLKSKKLSDVEAKEVQANLKGALAQQFKHLATQEPSQVEVRLKTALEKKTSGGYSEDSVLNEKMYQEDIDRLEREANHTYTLTAMQDPAAAAPYRELLDSSLTPLYQAYRDSEDSAKLGQLYKDSASVIKNKAEVTLLAGDNVAVSAAAVAISGYGSQALQTNLATAVKGRVIEMAEAAANNGTTPSILERSPVNKEFFTTVENSIKALYTEDGGDQEATVKYVNNILKTLGEDSKGRDIGQVVEFFSGPDFANLLKDFPQAVPASIEAAAQASVNEYGRSMRDQSNMSLSSILTPEQLEAKLGVLRKTNPRSAITIANQVTTDDLELVSQGGSVVFRALTEKGTEKARELNQQFASGYSTYYRAVSNMERSGFDKGFARDLPLIWPAKYGEQETEEEEKVVEGDSLKSLVGTKPPSSFKGGRNGTFTSNGITLTLVDGIVTEVR
jgi:hypothetical protein